MQKYILFTLVAAAILNLSNCTVVKEPEHRHPTSTTTTTTEETTLRQPASSTVETQTIRSF